MDGRGRMELVIGKKNRRRHIASHPKGEAKRGGASGHEREEERDATHSFTRRLSDKSERNHTIDPLTLCLPEPDARFAPLAPLTI